MKLLYVTILQLVRYRNNSLKAKQENCLGKNCFGLPEFSFHDLFVRAQNVKHGKRRYKRIAYKKGQKTLWCGYRHIIKRKR